MKRMIPTALLAALLAAPAALAQGDPPPDAPPPAQGDRERGPRGDRGDRPERGERGDREDRGERGDRGRRGPRGERGDRGRWRLDPDRLDDAIGIIERFHPELAESLRETQAQSPERAVRRIAEESPRVYELLRMRDEEPERFELHVQSMQVMRETWPLIRELRQAQRDADQPAVDELTGRVRAQVEAMFDIRVALRRLEIQDLRERLAELEADLAEQEDQRDALIDERTGEVVDGEFGGRRGERGGRGPRGDR